jgi:hypothetical protein
VSGLFCVTVSIREQPPNVRWSYQAIYGWRSRRGFVCRLTDVVREAQHDRAVVAERRRGSAVQPSKRGHVVAPVEAQGKPPERDLGA